MNMAQMARRVARNHPGWGQGRVQQRARNNLSNIRQQRLLNPGRPSLAQGGHFGGPQDGRPGSIMPPDDPRQRGYQGIDEIFRILSGGGLDQHQFNRLEAGYTGANGGIGLKGGARGAFAGLSPHAVHFLATSGLLAKRQPQLQSVEGLEGSALLQANIMNQLAGQQPARYGLAEGIDQDFLAQVLAGNPMGHSGYAKGFNSEGRILSNPPHKVFRPPLPGSRRRGGGIFNEDPSFPGRPRPPGRFPQRRMPGQTPPIYRRPPLNR